MLPRAGQDPSCWEDTYVQKHACLVASCTMLCHQPLHYNGRYGRAEKKRDVEDARGEMERTDVLRDGIPEVARKGRACTSYCTCGDLRFNSSTIFSKSGLDLMNPDMMSLALQVSLFDTFRCAKLDGVACSISISCIIILSPSAPLAPGTPLPRLAPLFDFFAGLVERADFAAEGRDLNCEAHIVRRVRLSCSWILCHDGRL